MSVERLPLSMLVVQTVTTLLTATLVTIGVLVIAHRALRGTHPAQRAAILRAIAEIARALLSRRK